MGRSEPDARSGPRALWSITAAAGLRSVCIFSVRLLATGSANSGWFYTPVTPNLDCSLRLYIYIPFGTTGLVPFRHYYWLKGFLGKYPLQRQEFPNVLDAFSKVKRILVPRKSLDAWERGGIWGPPKSGGPERGAPPYRMRTKFIFDLRKGSRDWLRSKTQIDRILIFNQVDTARLRDK
ncbi:hypothetical protein EVAR_75759_1 [Eumeta japonica]|uniref:Uncharacterized protein n=1 Tax=Eumeta variegata TaxID=151549 RepID=A0A4C1TFU0_EUMVA|nr:hypothetical protein EVAR_75759_1 [Eumeta japonica]